MCVCCSEKRKSLGIILQPPLFSSFPPSYFFSFLPPLSLFPFFSEILSLALSSQSRLCYPARNHQVSVFHYPILGFLSQIFWCGYWGSNLGLFLKKWKTSTSPTKSCLRPSTLFYVVLMQFFFFFTHRTVLLPVCYGDVELPSGNGP